MLRAIGSAACWCSVVLDPCTIGRGVCWYSVVVVPYTIGSGVCWCSVVKVHCVIGSGVCWCRQRNVRWCTVMVVVMPVLEPLAKWS